jgi:hypothetical protein
MGLKPALFAALSGTAEEAAEKAESATSAANAADGHKAFIAALKRCATENQSFSAARKALSLLGHLLKTLTQTNSRS